MMSKAAEMAADWWADRLDPRHDRLKFRTALRDLIDERLGQDGRVCLDCDYDPQDLLLDALHMAGIDCRGCMYSAQGILPMKHYLLVLPHELQPKEGYGNWTAVIQVPQ